eukprot:3860934-Rhodomonas_salina.1
MHELAEQVRAVRRRALVQLAEQQRELLGLAQRHAVAVALVPPAEARHQQVQPLPPPRHPLRPACLPHVRRRADQHLVERLEARRGALLARERRQHRERQLRLRKRARRTRGQYRAARSWRVGSA